MKVRDAYAEIEGRKEVVKMPSGALDIVSDDGRTLYSIKLTGAKIEISTGGMCKHGDSLYDTTISITPYARNVVVINRDKWQD